MMAGETQTCWGQFPSRKEEYCAENLLGWKVEGQRERLIVHRENVMLPKKRKRPPKENWKKSPI